MREGELRGALAIGFVIAVLGSACATRPRAAAALAAPAAPSALFAGQNESDDASEAEDDSEDSTGSADAEGADGAAGKDGQADDNGPCPSGMAFIEIAPSGDPLRSPRRFCIDKYEASLVEVLPDGSERAFPHYVTVDGHDVRAVSRPHSFPQGFISEVQAQDACAASGKRLCNLEEWKTACTGPAHTTFPYGDARRPGVCHDTGKSAVGAVFGAKAVAASTPYRAAPAASAPSTHGAASHANGRRAHVTKGRAAHASRPRANAAKTTSAKASSKQAARRASGPEKMTRRTGKKSSRPSSVDAGVWARLNEPALGQVEGALAKTGDHAECVNGFGVFDMVGNLHEWVATDPAAVHGTFAGGYYLDTTLNGDGCNYRTVAHAHDYHDYSTGFRCCAAAGNR